MHTSERVWLAVVVVCLLALGAAALLTPVVGVEPMAVMFGG